MPVMGGLVGHRLVGFLYLGEDLTGGGFPDGSPPLLSDYGGGLWFCLLGEFGLNMELSINDGALLRNGVKMPWLGFGVLWIPGDGSTDAAVREALEVGYRHFDTAAAYGNEEEVGRAVRASNVPRSEVFVTTKVWNVEQGYDPTRAAFDASLERLGFDYVDLCLVHWPFGGRFLDTWRAMEVIYREGRARAIGVSNFLVHHLKDLLESVEVPPVVNQVEHHARLQQPELREFCRQKGIQYEAWRPLMGGGVADVPALQALAEKYGKTPFQVVLRWMIQDEIVTISKSVHRDRMEANTEIFDFALAPDDVAVIDALDEGYRLGPHPDEFRPNPG